MSGYPGSVHPSSGGLSFGVFDPKVTSMATQTVSSPGTDDRTLYSLTNRFEADPQFVSHSEALALQKRMARTEPVKYIAEGRAALCHW